MKVMQQLLWLTKSLCFVRGMSEARRRLFGLCPRGERITLCGRAAGWHGELGENLLRCGSSLPWYGGSVLPPWLQRHTWPGCEQLIRLTVHPREPGCITFFFLVPLFWLAAEGQLKGTYCQVTGRLGALPSQPSHLHPRVFPVRGFTRTETERVTGGPRDAKTLQSDQSGPRLCDGWGNLLAKIFLSLPIGTCPGDISSPETDASSSGYRNKTVRKTNGLWQLVTSSNQYWALVRLFFTHKHSLFCTI